MTLKPETYTQSRNIRTLRPPKKMRSQTRKPMPEPEEENYEP